ncbi:MAG: hypothetical protein ABI405_05070 [Parafilimonas sp.]
MKNVVGNPARGESFYQRKREVDKIIDRILNGNNLQIAAPRRIGKTSILYYLLDNKLEDYIYVYVDTESVTDENEFYKKLLKEIIKADDFKKSNWFKNLMQKGNKFLSKIKSVKILGQEFDFDEAETVSDYKTEFENLLAGLEFEDAKRLILLIDEFPQTVQNIVEANSGSTEKAIHFLQSNREIRLNPDINLKVTFIYTGSIGLNHTVAAINGSAFINDLNSIEVEPLLPKEAVGLLQELLAIKALHAEQKVLNHLLAKIEWLIPFHIQLAAQEILSISDKEDNITEEIIELAFNNLIAARNNNHFEHYYSRLKKHFKAADFNYAEELLQTIANNNTIDKATAYNMALGHGVETQWRQVLEILMYDGYINNVGNNNIYRFNSPILKMWWLRFICK